MNVGWTSAVSFCRTVEEWNPTPAHVTLPPTHPTNNFASLLKSLYSKIKKMLDQSFNLSDSNVLDDIFQLPTLGVGSGLGRSDLITPFVRKSLQGLDSDFLSNSLEEYQLELKNRWQSSESQQFSFWKQKKIKFSMWTRELLSNYHFFSR